MDFIDMFYILWVYNPLGSIKHKINWIELKFETMTFVIAQKYFQTETIANKCVSQGENWDKWTDMTYLRLLQV